MRLPRVAAMAILKTKGNMLPPTENLNLAARVPMKTMAALPPKTTTGHYASATHSTAAGLTKSG